MQNLLSELDIKLVDVVKFFLAVVLPLTIWFLGIKHSIELNSIAIADVEKRSMEIEAKQDMLNTRVLMKLEKIGEDVAEIKGEMKRR